ncbi:hypothetical protein [Dactylosporangium sp. CA-092794]|uniref:hypothetical protein n=1 Tax=Dactylosporangium sp. CA-092794 TaxID=3239929 RepID=UPI003D8B1487
MRVPIRRRTLLAAVVVVATGSVAACDVGGGEPAEWHGAPDVLLPLLSGTVALRDRYSAVLDAFPGLRDRLGPLRDDHAQHVIALAREIGLPEAGPFPSVTPSAGAGTPSAGGRSPSAGAKPSTGPGVPSTGAGTSAGAGTPSGGASTSAGTGATNTPSVGASTPSAGTSTPSAGTGTPSAGTSATAVGTVPGDQGAAVSELVALEKQGRQDAEAACLAAPSYRAALLGSIAACRAGHQEVLT